MHGLVVSTLTQNPILTLFVVIGLGYVLGETRLFGFRFGVATVLFVGLAVGSLSPSISVPETIPTLGLIIFIYTIGIQTGPEFFKSLRQQGYRQSLFALVIVALGAGVTLLVSRPMHLARPRLAGLYTGAMTNTPALAAVRELLVERGRAAGFSPDQLRALSDEPVIAYSIAYPVGVIGVLVSFAVWRRRWKPTMEPLAEGPEIRVRNFEVINPAVIDRTVEEVLQSHRDPGFVISRIQHGSVERHRPRRHPTTAGGHCRCRRRRRCAGVAPNRFSAIPSMPTSSRTARSLTFGGYSSRDRRLSASASVSSI